MENVRHEASMPYDAENRPVFCHTLQARHEQKTMQL